MELSGNYLFADIAKKVQAFKEENPEANVISLGIGDVTQPLCPAVVEALHKAADEMGQGATFRGYGPERGYDFLRNAIVENDYRARGIDIDADEVFVSDGAKSDTGNFQELLSADCVVAVTDPVYPVYVDSNVMAGRRIVKLPCTADNNFVPSLPEERVDVIYLCYPNNPTGTTLTKGQLKKMMCLSFMMLHTRHSFRAKMYRIVSTRFLEPSDVLWSSIVSRKRQVLRASVADTRLFQKN